MMNVPPILHLKKKKEQKQTERLSHSFKSNMEPTLVNKIKISKLTFISLPFRSLGSKTKGEMRRKKEKKESVLSKALSKISYFKQSA